MRVTGKTLEKTSVQLPPDALRDVDTWPGLTRSEAIRLSIQRSRYFASLNSEEIAGIAHRFESVLRPALADLDYDSYRLAARSLPSIVEGFLRENVNGSFLDLDGRTELDLNEVTKTITELDPNERVGVLDCIVAERHRSNSPKPKRRRA